MARAELSVVIPVLNEEQALQALLPQLLGQRGVALEVIVSDGGSEDRTTAIAREQGAVLCSAPRGRGAQLNHGAAVARAELLLFLHADSSLPHAEFLRRALDYFQRRPGDHRRAGHFPLHFQRTAGRNELAFRYIEEKTRSGRRHTVNGDQGLLLQTRFFRELGGFEESMQFFEDQIIAERIFRHGRWVLLPETLTTSGRRFEREGFHRRYILMSLIMGLYWSDVHEFFPRARGLYRQHSEATRLRLWPYFAAIWAMLYRDLGLRRSIAAWWRVGGYVRRNAWQAFFFLDVVLRPRLGEGRYPCTRFHDRWLRPLMDNALADAAATLLCFVWFMLCLGPYFYLVERLGRHGRDPAA